jgi:hypothetical protein
MALMRCVDTKLQMFQIHEQLFGFLKEMILWLLHNNESNDKVWLTAFTALNYFLIHRGKIDRSK